jgi:aspartokinase-like uncharacterized kinase
MWVVKLGGSLHGSESLRTWLRAMGGRSDLVLVPGGGPFADQVRAAQTRWGFDDSTAHHLALLAMEQFGRMLCALEPGLAPAATVDEIRLGLRARVTPVWMPVPMVLADRELPHSWDLSSDSLAAWLCGRLGGEGLLLVKSAPLGDLFAGVAEHPAALSELGLVDRAFGVYAGALDVPIRLISDRDLGSVGWS